MGKHILVTATLVVLAASQTRADDSTYVAFEAGPVRPIALSADGTRLYAVNAPAARLEIWDVSEDGLAHAGSVPVGLEPVAVAERAAGEVWVVNHLSDSVSVIDVTSPASARVVRTLQVGDEPRDIVFAGTARSRAFIACAHRGQNRPGDPQLTTPGVGRADVWVLDAAGAAAPSIVTLFGDTPRALAATADGSVVYAAVFHSGNQTTCVPEGAVPDGFGVAAAQLLPDGALVPGGLPGPSTNKEGRPAPETGLIVQLDQTTSKWRDQAGRDWTPAVRFDLPDHDVFAIDADAPVPAETQRFDHVGTTIFALAVNPATGFVYAANTQARNEVRFEGPGKFGGTTVRGRLHQARVTVMSPGGGVTPLHLNPHVDYDRFPAPRKVAARTLAQPAALAVSSDGTTLYIAAFGSSKVAVVPAATLDDGSYQPDAVQQIAVSGGGPSGLALDASLGRLYVATAFDGGISIVDLASRRELAHVRMPDPEPSAVRFGRRFLYDAAHTSSNGEAACGSCHVFGDLDSLAWDLGNPDDTYELNSNPILVDSPFDPDNKNFHPMKGPMTTQSLRGLAGAGPMHWRGDRTGGATGGDALDEHAAFSAFNVAFQGLLGRKSQLRADEMSAFSDFALALRYPPNPVAALDGALDSEAQAGRDRYFGVDIDGVGNCNTCHVLDASQDAFGTSGQTTFELESQMFKVAHLRNMYQKVGMFGMPPSAFFTTGDTSHQGPQIRGFGFLHDGSADTLHRFVSTVVFAQNILNPTGFQNDTELRQMERFLLCFDTGLAPVVGQQETLSAATAATANPRVDLLLAQAAAGRCDVVAHGVVDGVVRGAVRLPNGTFRTDAASDAALSASALRARALLPGAEVTFTAVPPGEGERLGVDRDGDGVLDFDERAAGTDAGDPLDGAPAFVCPEGALSVSLAKLRVGANLLPAGDETFEATFTVRPAAGAPAFDAIASGLAFEIATGAGAGERVLLRRVLPPRTGWRTAGSGFVWDDPLGLAARGIVRATVSKPGKGARRKIVLEGRGDDFRLALADLADARFVVRLGAAGAACGADSLAGRAREKQGGDLLDCR